MGPQHPHSCDAHQPDGEYESEVLPVLAQLWLTAVLQHQCDNDQHCTAGRLCHKALPNQSCESHT